MNADDIFPGSWLSDNLFADYHDKYPYRVYQAYKNTGHWQNQYGNNGVRWE